MTYFGKILAIDGFRVMLCSSLPQNYAASLYHLYQPLLGIEAINLYETLVKEADLMEDLAIEKQTHHTLMSQLNLPLNKIYEARLKLEAVGLLRTYEMESDSSKLFTYEIIPPFAPEQFFQDVMLSELLLRQIGERRFSQLKNHHVKGMDVDKGSEITKPFHEVFETYEPKQTATAQTTETIQREPEMRLNPVDFKTLREALKQRNLPVAKILTETNERIITQLANLYDLETYEIENALLWALTEQHMLDVDQFHAACLDYFKNKQKGSTVKLTFKLDDRKKKQTTAMKHEGSRLERLIEHFETITPRQLLEDLSEGNYAAEQDLKMIGDIMLKQGLPLSVMNVLIHYALLQTDNKLSRPYIEKIASHWSRAKLKTAREAIEFATKQIKASKRPHKQSYSKKQAKKNEVIPDWFFERNIEKKNQEQKAPAKDEKRAEEELEAILKKYENK